MVLYLAVTADDYELPIAVDETVEGLARQMNTTANNIRSTISRNQSGVSRGHRYIKIEIPDSDDDVNPAHGFYAAIDLLRAQKGGCVSKLPIKKPSLQLTANEMVRLLLGMIVYFISEPGVPKKVREYRARAMVDMINLMNAWSGEFPYSPLLPNIMLQKLFFISTAASKNEIEKILKGCVPQYTGACIECNSPYHIDEEELLKWSGASLRAPPNDDAMKRMDLMMQRVYGISLYDL